MAILFNPQALSRFADVNFRKSDGIAGRAFHLEGVGELSGKATFSEAFMNRLAEIIGPEFKRDDFCTQ